MSIGSRHFLFLEDGTIRHVPQRVANYLPSGVERMPQFAGQDVRALTVYLDLEDRKPTRIRHYSASIFHFDANGSPRAGFLEGAARVMAIMPSFSPSEANDVVDLRPARARRDLDAVDRWQPTDRDITRVVEIIWPGTTGRNESKPARETGIKRRRRPMDHEAEHARREISSALFTIDHAISNLEMKSLRGLEDKLLADAADEEPVRQEVVLGVVEAVRRRQAMKTAWKRKGGRWIVRASLMHWNDNHSGESRELDVAVCVSRDAAAAKGREFLRKHADHFDSQRQVEVEMWPEIAAPAFARLDQQSDD